MAPDVTNFLKPSKEVQVVNHGPISILL